jgi:hypothetical protein
MSNVEINSKKLLMVKALNLVTSPLGVSRVAQTVWLRSGRSGDRGSTPNRGERIFPLTSVSRPALGPTQPPVQWVPGSFPWG